MSLHDDTNKYPGWRFLYSPRWLGYYMLLAVFALACVLLSNWQFDRRVAAQAQMRMLANNYEQTPVPLAKALPDAHSFNDEQQKWLPFTATGSYVGKPFLVRNRPGPSGTGSDIVQAFATTQGTVIFVNRGWVAVNAGNESELSWEQLPTADSEQQISLTARLRRTEPQLAGSAASATSAPSLNIDDMLQLSGLTTQQQIATAAYAALIAESPQQPHGQLPAKPELDEGPHLSYALQWIVFIAIAGTGIGYAARQEFKRFNRGSAQVARMEAKANARKIQRRAKRGASDAEVEDELLDSEN